MSVKEQVRRLWATCFHDSEAFMDLYFGCRYADSLNEYMESDGQVIAALQRIPYRLTYEGMNVPVAYISGACTHPAYRERGVMRKLLAQAHQSMFREGVLFSTLIPAEDWLKGYYARSGYTLCFQRRKKLLTASCLPVENFSNRWKLVEIPPGRALCGDAFRFYDHFQSDCENCIQHNWEDFHIILADLLLSGGQLWGAVEEGELHGLCFCLPEEEKLIIKEMVCRDKTVEQAMLRGLSSHYGLMELECYSFSDGQPYELGMARIIHVEALFRLLAGIWTGNHYFKVEGDEALPQNNGWHNLEGGIYSRDELKGQTYQVVSINELTRQLFDGKFPYMNLMLD